METGNTFCIYFSDISASDFCRYQTFTLAFFSSGGNVVWKWILHSGLWKPFCSNISSIPSIWKHLLEIYFKRILYYSQWERIFCLVEAIFLFIHFFWKPLLQLEGGQYFLKNLISARGNRFYQFFSDTDSNGSRFSLQWNRIFQGILHSG